MYKNKKFDYDLWTTTDDGIKRYWVRIRATQEVVEVDLKTLRFLRAEEKKIYRAIEDARNNTGTVLSYEVFEDEEISGEWLIDEKDLETQVLMQSEIDALTMAIQEGVGDGKGQGNGLYGLYQIVDENGGKLTITSGKSSIMLRNGALEKFDNGVLVADKHAGTIVDFQLDLSKKIDIQSALKSLDGFDGFDIRIDDMWQDDDWLKNDVYENCSGTGTRLAGKELRNDVLNIMRKTNAPMVLNFSSVKACSSSFIDEFIAKLMVEIGPLEFNKTIKIINMNQLVSHLCERSILMRMHQSWQEIIKTDEDVD